MPSRLAGLCSGASSASAPIARLTSGVICTAAGVPLAAVHDAVADGLDVAKCLQGGRGASLQGVQDTGNGIRMVPQRQLLAHLWLSRTADDQPGRGRRPVDATLRQQSLAFGLKEAKFQAARAGVTDQDIHRYLMENASLSGSTQRRGRHATERLHQFVDLRPIGGVVLRIPRRIV